MKSEGMLVVKIIEIDRQQRAADWAVAQCHHLLHRHLQTYSEMNQLS